MIYLIDFSRGRDLSGSSYVDADSYEEAWVKAYNMAVYPEHVADVRLFKPVE